ncbi:MAG: helix-turn-helix transcriptional regulator [Hyphomicrobiaceae bacterium]|nr:helix-turn-helix transcriptional regulator [Hyphomicrobiaceae bacterium]
MAGASRGAHASAIAVSTAPDIGLLVRSVRKERKLAQQELADHAGVGRRFLSELENGKPTLEIGKVLAVLATCGIELMAHRRR